MALKRIPAKGGKVEQIPIKKWNWNSPMGTLIVRTMFSEQADLVPARLNVLGEQGHPIIPAQGPCRFDGQNGRVFFYSPGEIELTVPVGKVTVSAVHGLTTPEVELEVSIASNRTTIVDLELTQVWNPQEAGWRSGDHHFHLNYGGTYVLAPEDILLDMKAEGIDVGIPLLANLVPQITHDRYTKEKRYN